MDHARFPATFPADLDFSREQTTLGTQEDRHAQCEREVRAQLERDVSCAVLDDLGPKLELFAYKRSTHIDPIHRHLQKGRKIVLTEDPKLHLVWDNGIIYIKPLPHYLLNHSFWNRHMPPEYLPQALGFVRSYERLICYPSDFELAKEAKLIPSVYSPALQMHQPTQQSQRQLEEGLQIDRRAEEAVTYDVFAAFIRCFARVQDANVSPRWLFGQIRLSRLHWAVRIFQPETAKNGFLQRLFYEEQFWQTTQFLNEFAAPLLFVFAALSLMLSAMQVVLAAKSGDVTGSWHIFGEVSAWFSILVIIVLVTVLAGLCATVVSIWVWQFQFGYQSWRRSQGKPAP